MQRKINLLYFIYLFTLKVFLCFEIELSRDVPGRTLHGDALVDLDEPIKIKITDCDQCEIAVRWSHLTPAKEDNKTDVTGCTDYSLVTDDFDPPAGTSPNWAFGQCFDKGGSEIRINQTHFSDFLLFSFSVAVFNYSKVEDGDPVHHNADYLTVPAEKLEHDQFAQYLTGGEIGVNNSGYFVVVAPFGETIFTKSLSMDTRSGENCVIEVFAGDIPPFDDDSRLLYTLTNTDPLTDLIWRTSMITYRYSNDDCYALTEHRVFLEEEDTPKCDLDDPMSPPTLSIIVSNDYPDSSKLPISESKCFTYNTTYFPRLSLYVEKISGGYLDVDLYDSNLNYTVNKKIDSNDANKVLKFCQLVANKITYTWHPSADANEESYVLARFRSNHPDVDIPDCPFVLEIPEASKKLSKFLLALIIVGAIFVAIVVGLLFYCLVFYRIVRWMRYLLLRRKFAEESFKSKKTYTSVYKNQSRYPKNQPVSQDLWEIDSSKLTIEKRIRRGAFSDVLFGRFYTELPCIRMFPALQSQFHKYDNAYEVAVKKPLGSSDDDRSSFLSEIASMKSVGYHRYLLSILGCCTIPESPMILTTFCELGDLRTQLAKKNPHINNPELRNSPSVLSPSDFLSISWQIADALMYLASKKYIHRDVAASNVLLTRNKETKLSDIGMSRINKETLFSARGGRLPVKWTAPEAIDLGVFTEKTDVWSYAVLLWEIYSLGESPYDNVQAREMLSHLRQGNLLPTPEDCPEFIEHLMLSCWRLRPMERPSFTVISSLIQTHLPPEQRMIREIDFS